MMSCFFVLFLSLFTCSSAYLTFHELSSELNSHWETFKGTFNKEYDEQFEYVRRVIWESNVKRIQQHNLEYDMGLHSYSLGVNLFTDLTHDEFREGFLTKTFQPNQTQGSAYMRPLNGARLPENVDWRTQGYVTAVKNQGQCGSCWAFSTTGSLEGQYFRKNKQLESFSEQQLVDCSTPYNNNGCNGGLMTNAFAYIKDKGIMAEADYAYVGKEGSCKYSADRVVTRLVGFVTIPTGDESSLQDALANVGPVSVAIDASHPNFQFYKNGVYDEVRCSTTELDHGVLVVGYGEDAGVPYWLVKNSWSAEWGVEGYIKMSRNKHNQCGIATMASYPQL